MSEKPTTTKATEEGQIDPISVGSGAGKDDTPAVDEGTDPKKESGLLQVPSRSSSQKNQPSASTGLSGITVGGLRNSIGGRSKDSRSSFLGRHRNGSASSKRTGGDSDPTNSPNMSQPSSPLQKRKKKTGGLLSLFGCCGVPDAGQPSEGEGDNENVHKLEKLPQRPATATKPKPQTPQEQTPAKQSNEKDTQPTEQTQKPIPSGAADEITPVEGESAAQPKAPAVTVETPNGQKQEEEQPQQVGKDTQENQDVVMQDETKDEPKATTASTETAEGTLPAVPAPPPAPEPIVTVAAETAEPAPEPQKWLLPPITPELKGRKCLVLDLDETLVHSSFKV